ncbi:MAG: histidine--tRNA ligase [Thermoplasmatota archaeon]
MIERPRGTRDLSPEEMDARSKVEETLRKVCESFGYSEILTPSFEHTELFLERSGPSIVEEIYDFEDKGGRDLALRPEFTASVMRMYAESLRERPKPLKLYYYGPAFRYERPQSGRYREFWHFGTELIGPDTPRADAENIALAYSCIKRARLSNFSLKISNLEILKTYLKEKGVPENQMQEIYHVIDKDEGYEQIEEEYGISEELEKLSRLSLDELEDKLEDTSSLEYTKEVFDFLSYYGIEDDYKFDLGTVRGLDYYRGVVFEVDAEELGAQKQICGGGDYNLGDIFGINVSSKGFAIGFDRLILALEREKKLPNRTKPVCFLIPIGEESLEYSYEVLKDLRSENIISDIDLMDRSVGKALSYADKLDYKYALLIGGDEIENCTVTVKDMVSGDQKTVKKEKLIEEIK